MAMINRGPNMALYVKSFSKKLSTVTSVMAKRSRITVPHTLQSPCITPFLQEFLRPVCATPENWASMQYWKNGKLEYSCFNFKEKSTYSVDDKSHQNFTTTINPCQHFVSGEKVCHSSKLHFNEIRSQFDTAESLSQIQNHGIVKFSSRDSKYYNLNTMSSRTGLADHRKAMVPFALGSPLFLINKEFRIKDDLKKGDPNKPPTQEQLEAVLKVLSEDLPRLFFKPLNYKIYHPEIIFEDNIRGKKYRGILDYVIRLMFLRLAGHVRFMYVSMVVLKITAHPEDGTIKVRWRIKGVRASKIFKFWKFKIWDWSSVENNLEYWHDGFSTYYVMGDGLIHKHVADKMMPDQDQLVEKKKDAVPVNTLFFSDTQFQSDPFSVLPYIRNSMEK